MIKKTINALIIEDNPGDFFLIQSLLERGIMNVSAIQAENYAQAKEILETNLFDIIFLDLSLPDYSGVELVTKMAELAGNIPILVLTGYADKKFGVGTLSLGVSDYLLKDELTSQQLEKSILYSIERAKINARLKESEEKHRVIFQSSPLPMWVYENDTFDFLDVNEAAIKHYGFSKEEFLSMNFKDLMPESSSQSINEILRICNASEGYLQIVCYQTTKSGEIITVELQSNEIEFEKRKAKLVLANDITQKTRAEDARKLSELRFKALVQKGSDVFSILDISGKYQYTGANSKIILGISPAGFKNKYIYDFIHPDDVQKVKEAFSLIVNEQSIQIPPYRFRTSEKQYIWLETIITNMINDNAVAGIVANSKNITEKIENELKLNISIERYNVVSKATSDIIWDSNLPMDEIIWNNGLSRAFGYPENMLETTGKWWESKVHPEDLERVMAGINYNIENRIHLWQDEYRFENAEGKYRHVFDRGFLVMNEQGNPQRFIGAMQDVTQTKIEEHRLRLQESVFANSTDAVILFSMKNSRPHDKKAIFDGEITYVNKAFTRITGIEKQEAVGHSISILKTLKISKANLRYSIRSLRHYESFNFELSFYNRLGKEHFLQLSMTPVIDSSHKLTHWAAIVSDITERTKKEHEITKAILGAQELERYEIGCELHDNINQILSATQLALGMSNDEEPEKSKYWVNQASSYIDLAIDEIRRLSHRLAPNSLDGTSFDEAVNSLVKSLNVNNRINFILDIDATHFTQINSEVQIHLYRIIQEQLNNIIKHSRAKNVTISSALSDSSLTLKIRDNGIGFNIYSVKKGIGLNNIVKRCDLIDAELSIISSVNEGCTVNIKLNISSVS